MNTNDPDIYVYYLGANSLYACVGCYKGYAQPLAVRWDELTDDTKSFIIEDLKGARNEKISK